MSKSIEERIKQEANNKYGNLFGTCNEPYHPNEVVKHCINSYVCGAMDEHLKSSQQIAEKDKEIERLKGLIESLYKSLRSDSRKETEIEAAWIEFSKQNNL